MREREAGFKSGDAFFFLEGVLIYYLLLILLLPIMGIMKKTARVCNLFSTLHLHSPESPSPKMTLYAYIVTHIIHYTLVVHRYILYVKLRLINETDLVDVYRIEEGLCNP